MVGASLSDGGFVPRCSRSPRNIRCETHKRLVLTLRRGSPSVTARCRRRGLYRERESALGSKQAFAALSTNVCTADKAAGCRRSELRGLLPSK